MHNALKTLLIAAVLSALAFMSIQLVSERNRQKNRDEQLENLPTCQFFDTNNQTIYLKSLRCRQVMLILFDPYCEHCLYEIHELKRNMNELKDVGIFLISSANEMDIKSFIMREQLDTIPEIRLLYCDSEVFNKTFSNLPYPTVLIYHGNGKLQYIFKGEIKIEALLGLLFTNEVRRKE